MPPESPNLTKIQQAILDALQAAPDGLDIEEIRNAIGDHGTQQHLDRRVRTLDDHFLIERSKLGKRTIYRLVGALEPGSRDSSNVSKTLRAKILHRDGRRCRMCGKTVEEDHIKLHIDHQIPREWGGKTEEDNLWSLCAACNEGKKNYFASFDSELMQEILSVKSVHERIARLLKLKLGEWVDTDLLQFVANFDEYQEDWQKRLRELRYTGLKISVKRQKIERRTKSFYRIDEWKDLPPDVTAFARAYEQQRATKNRAADRLQQ